MTESQSSHEQNSTPTFILAPSVCPL